VMWSITSLEKPLYTILVVRDTLPPLHGVQRTHAASHFYQAKDGHIVRLLKYSALSHKKLLTNEW
jgi:hypothetical protein